MPDGFRVTPEQLQGVSGRLDRGAADIDGINDELRAAVAPLRGEWTGEANARFEALWDQWAASAAALQGALEGVSLLMTSAAENYASTEAGVTSSFGS